MALPKFLQSYLPSYDLSLLDKDNAAVKREIITQVLNTGDDQAIRWLFKNCSLKEIKKVLHSPQRGCWFKDSLNYWTKILAVKIPPSARQKAVLELCPKENVSPSS